MPPPRTTPAPSMTPLDPDTTKKIVVEYGVWATDPQSGTYDTRQLRLPFPPAPIGPIGEDLLD